MCARIKEKNVETAPAFESEGEVYVVNNASVSELDNSILRGVLNLTEKNMRCIYESTQAGWDRKEKWIELTERTAYYLYVLNKEGSDIVAFVHYRFELDDEGTECILYCYEIQLDEAVQSIGLGTKLMKCLETIGKDFDVGKIILTCQKSNSKAENFYRQKLGYKLDCSDPCHNDYTILSKKITS